MLQLEQDSEVIKYEIEPFQIALNDNIHHYTPDFLVNDKQLYELKTSKHLLYTKEDERFKQEIEAATQYALKHNMSF